MDPGIFQDMNTAAWMTDVWISCVDASGFFLRDPRSSVRTQQKVISFMSDSRYWICCEVCVYFFFPCFSFFFFLLTFEFLTPQKADFTRLLLMNFTLSNHYLLNTEKQNFHFLITPVMKAEATPLNLPIRYYLYILFSVLKQVSMTRISGTDSSKNRSKGKHHRFFFHWLMFWQKLSHVRVVNEGQSCMKPFLDCFMNLFSNPVHSVFSSTKCGEFHATEPSKHSIFGYFFFFWFQNSPMDF